MNTKELLKSIGTRTNGDLYFGVVGPVRSGKSTFIKKFMEIAVIPNISDEGDKKRAVDELPQSGVGKTITTTEPKFVPNNSVMINVEDSLNINVRLVDCVGYVIDDAKGYKDEDGVRMVKTPWFEDAIPFDEAARIGTQKVISDHSTIGIVVTTDGSIADIDRANYVEAENEIINELNFLRKVLDIYMSQTLVFKNKKILCTGEELIDLIKTITNAENANIELETSVLDSSCGCINTSEIPILDVDKIWILSNNERKIFKYSYPQAISLFERCNISLKYIKC